MDLSTTYMGFKLPHPLIPGAGPLVDDVDTVRRLVDAGAPLIVMRSLFEEQIVREEVAITRSMVTPQESYAEALTYFPEPKDFLLGPEEYLEHVRRIKAIVAVPVIGSLNGTTEGGWLEYARLIAQAGADGLELNLYEVAADFNEPGEMVELRGLQVVRAVRESVAIPVAVKLSPFYSSIAHYARKLDELGVDALVLFNRFYQPDIDLEELELKPNVLLSTPQALRLPLTWIGILYGRVHASLAATSGIHGPEEVIKLLMVGSHVTMLCSSLLRNGINHLRYVERGLRDWMEEHEYESIQQMQGSMSVRSATNAAAFERANYMKVLSSYVQTEPKRL